MKNIFIYKEANPRNNICLQLSKSVITQRFLTRHPLTTVVLLAVRYLCYLCLISFFHSWCKHFSFRFFIGKRCTVGRRKAWSLYVRNESPAASFLLYVNSLTSTAGSWNPRDKEIIPHWIQTGERCRWHLIWLTAKLIVLLSGVERTSLCV